MARQLLDAVHSSTGKLSTMQRITVRQHAIQVAVGAALAVGAIGVQAATMTLSNWTYGNGNNVQASAPVYNGQAGGFSGTLAGSVGLDGAIQTYCVELSQSFNWNVGISNYNVLTASTYFGVPDNKALKLGRLFSYVKDTNLFANTGAGLKDDVSTSLQLAVWNIVYDTDLTLAAGGVFSDTSGFAATATSLLSASQNWNVSLNMYVLKSDTSQDQLIWVDNGGANNVGFVPEPASLALVGAALLGLATARRRRG
jgi:hypothetical protein